VLGNSIASAHAGGAKRPPIGAAKMHADEVESDVDLVRTLLAKSTLTVMSAIARYP
jgi:hypothetical protein